MDCKYCGSSGYYLKSKGTHVGLYCRDCHKWLKWVGKKELSIYKKSGVKIYEDGVVEKGLNHQSVKKQSQVDVPYENNKKEKNNCVTCLSHSLEEIDKVEKSLNIGVKDNVLGVFLNGSPLGFYKISYCPTCGRKIEGGGF